MSEPNQVAGNELVLNAVWFQVLKANPIRDQAGNVTYGIVGIAATLAEASTISARHPGSLIVVSTVLFQNTAPLLQGARKPVTQ